MEARSHFDLPTIQRSRLHFTGGNRERSGSFPKATQLRSSRARTRTESRESPPGESPTSGCPRRQINPTLPVLQEKWPEVRSGENTGPCGVTPSLSCLPQRASSPRLSHTFPAAQDLCSSSALLSSDFHLHSQAWINANSNIPRKTQHSAQMWGLQGPHRAGTGNQEKGL